MRSPKPASLSSPADRHCSFGPSCMFRSATTRSTAICPIAGDLALAAWTMLLQPMNDPRQAAVPAVHPVSWVMGARRENLGLKCADPYEPDGHISPSMRAELVLWMDAFAHHLGGLPDGTLCHAVAYLDSILSVRPVPAHDEVLQLVAAGAQSSSRRRLGAQVVEAFLGTTMHVVEEMEWELFMDLGCAMDGPTAYTLVDHFTRFFEREDELLVRSLALRLVNLTLGKRLPNLQGFFGFVGRILPSAMAASALFLARQTLGVPVSHNLLEEVTGYKDVDLMGCICALEKLLPTKNL
ncbi:hypothetical protein VPH35_091582 [Triticum aestivum]